MSVIWFIEYEFVLWTDGFTRPRRTRILTRRTAFRGRRCRTSASLAANPEELVGVDSPLREASPRPEVRVVAPSHRPPPTSVLAAANGGHHHHHHAVSMANRKSVSILLPEQTSGWPKLLQQQQQQQQHGFVHRCDEAPLSI